MVRNSWSDEPVVTDDFTREQSAAQPRDTATALDLHVGITGTEPQIWRVLRVPVGNSLSDLHAAIQRAFGWQDYHLHMFIALDKNRNQRLFTSPQESAEELGAELDTEVKIGDVMAHPGERLAYEYDFGDSWGHEITVVGNTLAPADTFSCLDGANRGPVEDSGGIGGYHQLCTILSDERNPDYGRMAEWYHFVTGQSASKFDPSEFDIEAVNDRLSRLSVLTSGEGPATDEIAEVVRPVKWLLQRAGTDGLELTKDGYLKPAVVAETMAALAWEKRWYGKFNRETQTLPVWELRTKRNSGSCCASTRVSCCVPRLHGKCTTTTRPSGTTSPIRWRRRLNPPWMRQNG